MGIDLTLCSMVIMFLFCLCTIDMCHVCIPMIGVVPIVYTARWYLGMSESGFLHRIVGRPRL